MHIEDGIVRGYPAEEMTSVSIFTRLWPSICQQLLLHGKPDTFQRAAEDVTTIKYATSIKYALNFKTEVNDVCKIAAVHKSQPQSFEDTQKLQDSPD